MTCWINFLSSFRGKINYLLREHSLSETGAERKRDENELEKHDKRVRCFSSSFQRACNLIHSVIDDGASNLYLGGDGQRWISHMHALNICIVTSHLSRTGRARRKVLCVLESSDALSSPCEFELGGTIVSSFQWQLTNVIHPQPVQMAHSLSANLPDQTLLWWWMF